MDEKRYEPLRLKNQLCFPLYAASREVIKRYRPFLDALDLTYTQYVAMMVIWEKEIVSVKELGEQLYLDSGTLSPLLKSLETKGYLKRSRSSEDERILLAELTEKGKALQEKALQVPAQMTQCIRFDSEDALQLYRLLYKLLDTLR